MLRSTQVHKQVVFAVQGFQQGNKLLFDLAGGIRLEPTAYIEPVTVWLVELNGEYTDRSIKAGVQIPVASVLNGE
jgi:hypothetical protein